MEKEGLVCNELSNEIPLNHFSYSLIVGLQVNKLKIGKINYYRSEITTFTSRLINFDCFY
jgi:hypothetical protein